MTEVGDGQGAPHSGDTIVRNAAFALAAQAATAAFTTLLTLYLVRALSTSAFGVFSLALSIGTLAAPLADFGVAGAVARYVADHREDPRALASILSDGLRLKLGIGLVVSGLMAGLAPMIADAYGEPALTTPLRVFAACVFLQSLMLFWIGAFVALRRVSVNLWITLAESIAETTLTIAFVVASGGVTAATLGRTAGYLVGTAYALYFVWSYFGSRALRPFGSRGLHLGDMTRYAGSLAIVGGAWVAFTQIDTLVIGAVLDATAVGIFQAPLRLTIALGYPAAAMATAVAPRLSFGGRGPEVAAIAPTLRLLLVGQVAIVVPLIVWADPVVHLFLGSDYADSAPVLRALAPYVFAAGFSPLLSLGVTFLGAGARRVPIAIGTVLLNLILDLILIPKIGVIGGAIGTDIAFTVYVLAHLRVFTSLLGLRLGTLAVTAIKCTVAGATMAAVLAAFGTDTLSWVQFAVGSLAALIAYLAMLLVTRETTPTELRGLVGAARAQLGR